MRLADDTPSGLWSGMKIHTHKARLFTWPRATSALWQQWQYSMKTHSQHHEIQHILNNTRTGCTSLVTTFNLGMRQCTDWLLREYTHVCSRELP